VNAVDDEYGIVCPECRATIPLGASECGDCGYAFSAPRRRSEGSSSEARATSSATVEAVEGLADFYASRRAARAGQFAYGGFWRRFAARVVDGLVFAFLEAFVVGFAAGLGHRPWSGFVLLLLLLGLFLAALLYEPLMTAGAGRGTLGKQLLGLAVTDLDGNRISVGRSFGRWLATIPAVIPLYLGWVLVAFRRDKRGLHDLLAGTIVIRVV
jgi:uncharacterized RDD family membrane protein YckC